MLLLVREIPGDSRRYVTFWSGALLLIFIVFYKVWTPLAGVIPEEFREIPGDPGIPKTVNQQTKKCNYLLVTYIYLYFWVTASIVFWHLLVLWFSGFRPIFSVCC